MGMFLEHVVIVKRKKTPAFDLPFLRRFSYLGTTCMVAIETVVISWYKDFCPHHPHAHTVVPRAVVIGH